MSCIEQMKYKLYLERTTFKDAREYIEKNSEEIYYVDPGYKIFKDYYIIGMPPVAMGVRGKEMLFTYVKPCHGTFVMGIDSEEEITRLRENEAKKIKKSLKGKEIGKVASNAASNAAPMSFSDVYKN